MVNVRFSYTSGEDPLESQLVDAGVRLHTAGLSPGCSGNISARVADGFLISPSATKYEELDSADVVRIRMNYSDEMIARLQPKPSSEWRFHKAIYRAYPAIGAVVHCHSHYAQVLACAEGVDEVPADFTYMMQVFNGTVRCMPYETPGSEALANSAVLGLKDRHAVLLANHGSIAVGESLDKACYRAEELERLSHVYFDLTRPTGYKKIPAEKMEELPPLFESYGKKK